MHGPSLCGTFLGFVSALFFSSDHQANTYHNFIHAVDVTHAIFQYMNLMQARLLDVMIWEPESEAIGLSPVVAKVAGRDRVGLEIVQTEHVN